VPTRTNFVGTSVTLRGSVLGVVTMNAFIGFVFGYALVRRQGLGIRSATRAPGSGLQGHAFWHLECAGSTVLLHIYVGSQQRPSRSRPTSRR